MQAFCYHAHDQQFVQWKEKIASLPAQNLLRGNPNDHFADPKDLLSVLGNGIQQNPFFRFKRLHDDNETKIKHK